MTPERWLETKYAARDPAERRRPQLALFVAAAFFGGVAVPAWLTLRQLGSRVSSADWHARELLRA